MAVIYEELDGSPTFNYRRDGSSAIRKFLIPWDQIDPFIAEVFVLPSSGYSGPASIPGKGYLVAESADVEPFDDPTPGEQEDPCEYGKAQVTVHYSTDSMDGRQGPVEGTNGQHKGDGSGPGGEAGSSANSDVEYITHDVDVAAEFITLPDHGLRWALTNEPANGVNAGYLLCMVDHLITIPNVLNPPWGAIRGAVGKINDGDFAGAGNGTALFTGCKSHQGRDKNGRTVYKLEYLFTEKSKGWNYFRHHSGAFLKLETTQGNDIYDSADFSGLFAVQQA